MRKTVCLIISALLGLFLIPLAYADNFNMTEVPGNVATYFSIDEFSAKLLVSFIFLLFATVMILFTLRKQSGQALILAVLIVDFVLMGFLVAIGWLDYWLFLILSLIVAVLVAGQIRDLITGK